MQMTRTPMLITILALVAICAVSTPTQAAQPIPIGSSTTTFTYETAQGDVSFSGLRNFNGTGPGSATDLADADNIRAFNSVNAFGRRTVVDNTHPEAIGPDESLVSHSFFKIDINADYFPGLITNGNLTITIDNIQFPQPVTLETDTMMMHLLYSPAQTGQIMPAVEAYNYVYNHHMATSSFRDLAAFLDTPNMLIDNFPPGISNFVLHSIEPVITGNGTRRLGISLTIPYNKLKHIEQNTQTWPATVPAPQGFLEPFHLHLEYVVAEALCTETVIDSDGDNDIDLNDYATFQRCLSGPQ